MDQKHELWMTKEDIKRLLIGDSSRCRYSREWRESAGWNPGQKKRL